MKRKYKRCFISAESIRRSDHFRYFWIQRQLLVRRASWVIVQTFNVPVLAAKGDVVESRDSKTLTSIGWCDEASFWGLLAKTECTVEAYTIPRYLPFHLIKIHPLDNSSVIHFRLTRFRAISASVRSLNGCNSRQYVLSMSASALKFFVSNV